jgi:putative NADH-flavin reductase
MKLLVIGATGRTGRHVVQQGVERGHAITAFTRRPQEVTGISGLQQIIPGDGLNLDDIRKAVQGQDAVISAVSLSGIANNLISAMPEAGVRRLVMTSTLSIANTRPWLALTLVWVIFREAYIDATRAEGMLQASDLDWTIVRATRLTDQPMTGQVHLSTEPNDPQASWSLARADYAMTLLDTVENPRLISKELGVTTAKGAKPIMTVQEQHS